MNAGCDKLRQFIICLKDIDPCVCNADNLTALEIAAKRSATDSVIIETILHVFLPFMTDDVQREMRTDQANIERVDEPTDTRGLCCACCWRLSNKVSESCDQKADENLPTNILWSVFRSCATNGLPVAVAMLLRHGVKPHDVVHDLMEESIKCPGKVAALVSVYNSIVENIAADTFACKDRIETFGSKPHGDHQLQRAVRQLVAVTRHGKNVLERAIEIGAREILLAIIETQNVFRFDGFGELQRDFWRVQCELVTYDVTNMIRSTLNRDSSTGDTNSLLSVPAGDIETGQPVDGLKYVPDKSYLELIVENEDIWRQTDILKCHPFKKLSKSYIWFLRRVFLVVFLIHLIYMTMLSLLYMPNRCSLNIQFHLNITECNTTNDLSTVTVANAEAPSIGWLVWPSVLSLYYLYVFLSHLIDKSVSITSMIKNRQSVSNFRNVGGEAEYYIPRLVDSIVDNAPIWVFTVSIIVWYAHYDTFTSHANYLMSLSVVFLFGWISNFTIFNRVTKELHIFSIVLRAALVEHTIKHFMPVFFFTVIGFSCAFHVLDQTKLPDERQSTLNSTVYQALLSTFGTGNLYDETVDQSIAENGGNLDFIKVIFATYVIFTALVLLNYLITLLNGRYVDELKNAENAWSFNSLAILMRLDHSLGLCKWRIVHKFDYWFCCHCWPRRQIRQSGSRYFVEVQKWRPWSNPKG